MSDKKIEELVALLDKYEKELSESKAKSKKFLIESGIITENGNLKKPYKHLCIPQEQA